MKLLSFLLTYCVGWMSITTNCEAGGFFRRVPEVGEWARYEVTMLYVFTPTDANFDAAENSVEKTGCLTLKCVGEETVDEVWHLWIESRFDFLDPAGYERWTVLKVLVPADHVVDGPGIEYMVRGWTRRNDITVSPLNLDPTSYLEYPLAFESMFSFPFSEEAIGGQQNKTLTINGEDVQLTDIESGSLTERELEDVHMSGEATWWPSADHAFGVAAAEQLWTIEMHEPIAILVEYAIEMNLAETGTDAVSDLPEHN